MSERCFFSKKARDAWSSSLIKPQENMLPRKRLLGLSPPPCANCSDGITEPRPARSAKRRGYWGRAGGGPEDLMAQRWLWSGEAGEDEAGLLPSAIFYGGGARRLRDSVMMVGRKRNGTGRSLSETVRWAGFGSFGINSVLS